jgi:hypothetical protein
MTKDSRREMTAQTVMVVEEFCCRWGEEGLEWLASSAREKVTELEKEKVKKRREAALLAQHGGG